MAGVNEYIELNRAHWDEVTPLHVASEFYDVASFKAGASSLLQVERDEVSDVRGKTLLHLQCHFGMDTLSWAREGALVTGVDFSSAAIDMARRAKATAVEAYPLDGDLSPSSTSTGYASTFARAGFKEVARRSPERPMMRYSL